MSLWPELVTCPFLNQTLVRAAGLGLFFSKHFSSKRGGTLEEPQGFGRKKAMEVCRPPVVLVTKKGKKREKRSKENESKRKNAWWKE